MKMTEHDSSRDPADRLVVAASWARVVLSLALIALLAGATFLYFNIEEESMTTGESSDGVEYIEIQTGMDPEFSVIWLHGLGADGHDFEPLVPELRLSPEHPVRFIFPHAPVRPITVNGGMSMRGWYDVYDVPLDPAGNNRQDREGLEQSAAIVTGLIEQENRRGIPSDRIFLAGFSQGGAVVLFAGLRYPEKLAGLIALSTYLPVSESTEVERHDANQGTPIFMAHGTDDPIIPMAASSRSNEMLQALGYNVDWKSYPMPHSIHPDEIGHIAGFFSASMTKN